MAQLKIVIIGSGLSGSLLANGLIANNIDVAVYERLERHANREGYQIRLGAPALIGMRACLSSDQITSIAAKFGRAGGLKSAAPIIYDNAFQPLIDLSRFPAYTKSAPINRGILRDALSDPVDNAGKLTYSRSFVRYEILKSGTSKEEVRVWLDDGSYDDCDILIGADGSHSKINIQLGLNNIQDLAKHLSMIAKCDLPTESFLKLSPALRGGPTLAFSNERSLYFAAYLPDKTSASSKRVDISSTNESEFDDKLSSCMFGFHTPLSSTPENSFELTQEEKWNQLVAKNLEGWAEQYWEVVNLVRQADLYVYKARVSQRPAQNWRQKVQLKQEPERGHSRVWLMGDAMHAMLPNRGMGGNQSMRDAATVLPLLKKLSEIKEAERFVPQAAVVRLCKEYEDEMIPRAFEWVKKSGGSEIVPIDSATVKGKIFFFIAGYLLHVAYFWTRIVALFKDTKMVDDAPELRD